MKLVLVLLLFAPLLTLAQNEGNTPAVNKGEGAETSAWIDFYQKLFVKKQAAQLHSKLNNAESVAEINEAHKALDLALDVLVKQNELIAHSFKYIPAKLSKEQSQLYRYCIHCTHQVYGYAATYEMFGLWLNIEDQKPDPSKERELRTRLPERFHLMLKTILENDDLANIKLPRPVTLEKLSNEKELWVFFYKNLDLANDMAKSLKLQKRTNPLIVSEAIISINQVKEKLTDQGVLQSKKYPFHYAQLSKEQTKQLHKLTSIENQFGEIAVLEMLGGGNSLLLKDALLPAVKSGKLKMNLADLNQNLTLYLPLREFKKVSQYLDSIKVSQP